jgi:uridylate kinase
MADPAFKRILLKLSGEALMGRLEFGVDPPARRPRSPSRIERSFVRSAVGQ